MTEEQINRLAEENRVMKAALLRIENAGTTHHWDDVAYTYEAEIAREALATLGESVSYSVQTGEGGQHQTRNSFSQK